MERGDAGDFIGAKEEGYRGFKRRIDAGDPRRDGRARGLREEEGGVGADFLGPHGSESVRVTFRGERLTGGSGV